MWGGDGALILDGGLAVAAALMLASAMSWRSVRKASPLRAGAKGGGRQTWLKPIERMRSRCTSQPTNGPAIRECR